MLCLVTQSCPTFCDHTDCSPPGPSIHGDFPGKNTRVGCHSLLQGILPTQGLNLGFPHCRWILYCLSHQGSSYKTPKHLKLWKIIKKVRNSKGNTCQIHKIISWGLFFPFVHKSEVLDYIKYTCVHYDIMYGKVIYCTSLYKLYLEKAVCSEWAQCWQQATG